MTELSTWGDPGTRTTIAVEFLLCRGHQEDLCVPRFAGIPWSHLLLCASSQGQEYGRGRAHSQQTDVFSNSLDPSHPMSHHYRAQHTTNHTSARLQGQPQWGISDSPEIPPLHPHSEPSGTNFSKPALAWASGVGSFCQLMSVQKTQQELFPPSDRQTSEGGQVWLIHTSVAVFASSSFQPLERGTD